MGVPFVGRQRELASLERALHSRARVLVIAGEPGVGKTRLAQSLIERARRRRWVTPWVSATGAAAETPLGAFFDVLEDVPVGAASRLEMLHSAAASIRRLGRERRLLLTVDDIDLLDATSIALVRALADDDDVGLLVTHRMEQAAGQALDAVDIAAEGRTYIELAPLDPATTRDLAEQFLGVPLTDASFERLWELSRGYPLFVRELLLAAREGSGIRIEAGHALLSNALPVSTRVREVVELRLAGLPPRYRETLEILALNEPVGVAPMTSLWRRETALEMLEERRLIVCETSRRRRQFRLGHPMYGEVLRRGIPQVRRERLATSLADVLEAMGGRRRDDALTVARLRLHGRSVRDPAVLLDASRVALSLFDHRLAEELAGHAAALGAGADADLLRGEALANQGAVEKAERVLSDIGWDGVSEPVAAKAALVRARNLIFASGDARAAHEVIEQALRRAGSDAWRDELGATLALCRGVLGDFEAASAAGARAAEASMSDRATLSVLIVSTLADALLGRLAAAEEGVQRARALVPALRRELPFAECQLVTNQLMIAWHSGRLDEAARLGQGYLEDALHVGASDPAALTGVFMAMISLERGRCEDAMQYCLASNERGEGRSVFGMESTVVALRGRAAAGMGHVDRAAALVDELSNHASDVRARVLGVRARTWLLAAQGKLGEAAEVAASDGMDAVKTSHIVWGASAMYDAVRYGRPELVETQLTALADDVEGELVRAFADHAHAAVHRDGHGLECVARALARMGAHGYAAEAAGHAAAAHARRGRGDAARRLSVYGHAQARRCQGRGFPVLVLAHEPLTDREHQVARLAAGGASSREIAERLVVSVRTVDNHLSAVYRKTGVAGRHELAPTLGLPVEARSGAR